MSMELTRLDHTSPVNQDPQSSRANQDPQSSRANQDPQSSRANQAQGGNGNLTGEKSRFENLFQYTFYIHFLPITALVIFLTLQFNGVLSSAANTHHFPPKEWYLLVLCTTVCAGIIGFTWQAFARFDPSRTLKAALWLSPMLTCGLGILLICILTPGSIAASVIALASFAIQVRYAWWVRPGIPNAIEILKPSITNRPPKVRDAVIMSIAASTLFSYFLMSGIGGAIGNRNKVYMLCIFLLLWSLAWTMQIAKNMMISMVSHIKCVEFAAHRQPTDNEVKSTFKNSMGSICIGSILVPILGVIRGLARCVSLVSGGVDYCSGVATNIAAYVNRWGFVHVALYSVGIVEGSMQTWELFKNAGMEKLIDSDLTSSFCFLCGVATGSICALVGGIWAIVIQNTYATEVLIYTFFVGYFVTRVAMAWIQASVAGYFIAYAESPEDEQFDVIRGFIQA